MIILGLDVGEKRIGVAKVNTDTKIAVPVKTVSVDGTEWIEIENLSKLNGTKFFVIGLPRNNNGDETAQSLYVRNFAKVLTEKITGAKIRFQDESLTSVVAEERLKKSKKKFDKKGGDIDKEAAAIILQDFIESFKPEQKDKSGQKSDADRSDKSYLANKIENATGTASALAKKNVKKINLNRKKAMSKAKKWKIFGIPAIVIIIGLAGTTAVLKCRDFIRKNREEEWAKQEAEMTPDVFSFTIVPGETIFDVKKDLAEKGYSDAEIEEAFSSDYDFDFLASRPAGASLEGYLFGETYEFYSDSTVKDILTKYLEGMGIIIKQENLEQKFKDQGLTLFEGITLASVVQKEAPSKEHDKVAQVFLTRLAYGWRLGSDVTTSYALDIIDPKREVYRDNQSALKVDSCYNTRLYTGLPCGPISNPGYSALMAVANPSSTSYLYFLTGDDGVMYYSYTEEEHNNNAYLHCKELCGVSL